MTTAPPNKTLHRTAIALRSIAAGEVCRWVEFSWWLWRRGYTRSHLELGRRRSGADGTASATVWENGSPPWFFF
jgi:hypothetical protein